MDSDGDDDVLCFSSSEDEDIAGQRRKLKRKKPGKDTTVAAAVIDDEEPAPLDFDAGMFEDDVEDAPPPSVLPIQRTIDVWLSESGLLVPDRRPNYPRIPLPEGSFKALRFKETLDQGEAERPDHPDTARLRKIWNAYVEHRDAYVAPKRVSMLSRSTSNFSGIAQFFDIEAGVEEGNNAAIGKKHNRKGGTQGFFTQGFFNTVGLPGDAAAMQEHQDEWDYDDGFCVRDAEGGEASEDAVDPADMSGGKLDNYCKRKRRKLADEQEDLATKLEELQTLQVEIAGHRQSIGDLVALITRCEELQGKGKNEIGSE